MKVTGHEQEGGIDKLETHANATFVAHQIAKACCHAVTLDAGQIRHEGFADQD